MSDGHPFLLTKKWLGENRVFSQPRLVFRILQCSYGIPNRLASRRKRALSLLSI